MDLVKFTVSRLSKFLDTFSTNQYKHSHFSELWYWLRVDINRRLKPRVHCGFPTMVENKIFESCSIFLNSQYMYKFLHLYMNLYILYVNTKLVEINDNAVNCGIKIRNRINIWLFVVLWFDVNCVTTLWARA